MVISTWHDYLNTFQSMTFSNKLAANKQTNKNLFLRKKKKGREILGR